MKNKVVKSFLILLGLIFVLVASYFIYEFNKPVEKKEEEIFYRIDNNITDGEVSNLTIIKNGMYSLNKIDKKYNVSDYKPVLDGLDDLSVSFSNQFSREQFYNLTPVLGELVDYKTIYFIDLRSESHGFVNGLPISFYKKDNLSNEGLDAFQITVDEEKKLTLIKGKNITAYEFIDNVKTDSSVEINVREFQTEKDLVSNAGFNYKRIPATENVIPSNDKIDEFINFIKVLDINNIWLHFHSDDDMSRTSIFVSLFDMMKNPNLSLEDIIYRDAMIGTDYLLYEGINEVNENYYIECSKLINLLYQYVKDNHETNYDMSWSSWVANR